MLDQDYSCLDFAKCLLVEQGESPILVISVMLFQIRVCYKASLYEKELFLNVQKGIVISEREIDNTHYYDDLKGMEERNMDDLWGAIFGIKRKKSQKTTNRIKLWLNKILER